MSAMLLNLLECSLIMGILTLLLTALTPLLGKKYSAKGLYAAWLVLMIGFFFLWRPHTLYKPAVTLNVPVTQSALETSLQTQAATALPETPYMAETLPEQAATVMQAAPQLSLEQILLLVWGLGIAVSLGIQLYRHIRFRRMVKRWQKPITDEGVIFVLEKVKLRMGIKRDVAIKLCQPVDSPMLVGLLKPTILLPDLDLTDEELSLVLCHELTHMVRHDLFIKLLMMLVTAIHWFNPAVYMASRTLAFYQEASCDAAVTQGADEQGRQFYSETIISIIRRQTKMRTALSTSFYGGKNGMKRRILSIMEGKGKKLGAVMVCVSLIMVFGAGLAFAMSFAPETTAPASSMAGKIAYVHCPDGKTAAPVITSPTVNDIDIPVSVAYPGTQVTILSTTESSALRSWGSVPGEPNWAHIAIGGDGDETGFSGNIPLYYLSDTKLDEPYTASVVTETPTSHANLYQRNSEEALVIDAVMNGEAITLLERVNKWYHVKTKDMTGFIALENVAVDAATAKLLEDGMPDRFDTISREESTKMRQFNTLVTQKSEEYGGKYLEEWSLEDKAWFGQLEETYLGTHDHYYMMPSASDLQKEQAIEIAWNAFVQGTKLDDLKREDFTENLGFYSVPERDPNQKYWDVKFIDKATGLSFSITISSPQGQVDEFDKSYVEYYLKERAVNDRFTKSSGAIEQWEKQKGDYRFWSVIDKAAYAKEYGDGLCVLPSEGAITQEQAILKAKEEVEKKFHYYTMDTMKDWKVSVSYCRYEDGKNYWQNGVMVVPNGQPVIEYWNIDFFDANENQRPMVCVDAMTGEINNIHDPETEGNG